jgi:hypothetical protein
LAAVEEVKFQNKLPKKDNNNGNRFKKFIKMGKGRSWKVEGI